MFHPLIKTLAIRPHLLIDHLGGYADLVTVQAKEALQSLKTRAILAVSALVAVLLATVFTGVALMLLALMPIGDMHHPWLLLVVPLVPWIAAAGCAWTLMSSSSVSHFDPIREQIAADAALFKEASEA